MERHAFRSPCAGGASFSAGDLSAMAFLVGVLLRMCAGGAPPPDASSDLARPLCVWRGLRRPV